MAKSMRDLARGFMGEMPIFVLTAKRPERQITSDLLCDALINHVVLQDPGDNVPEKLHRVVETYEDGGRIAEKRQFVLGSERERGSTRLIMLDDDLTFRRRLGDGSFVKAEAADLGGLFSQLRYLLRTHAHVGIIDEFMCQTKPRGHVERGRYNQVLGYNLDLFPNCDIRFRLPVNEEHDVHLQLGALGLAPAISCEWTKSSKIYASGGCATWRTPQIELAGHEALASNFPDLVRVVDSKNSLSGKAIRVKWAKAVKT